MYYEFRHTEKSLNALNVRITKFPDLKMEIVVGLFYGASKNGHSGGEAIMKLAINHSFEVWMGCRSGSNTRAKMLALRMLLTFACWLGISKLQVLGDSQVILELANQKYKLQVVALQHWSSRVREQSTSSLLFITYTWNITIYHVDRLSKRALSVVEGTISFYELKENLLVS
jgi:ribonuclease HI